MSPFGQVIASWQSFYILAGTAAATLVGLLFIAVSLHLDILTIEANKNVALLAEHTLMNFFSILMIALFFLVPNQSPLGLGLPLLAVAVTDVLREARIWFLQLKNRSSSENHEVKVSRGFLVIRILFPVLYNITLLYVSITVLLGRTDALEWLVWVVAFLLIRASLNAWNMMFRLAVVRQNR